jgi:hypothetical protein
MAPQPLSESHARSPEYRLAWLLAYRSPAASPSAKATRTSLSGADRSRRRYASQTQAASPMPTVTPKAAAALGAARRGRPTTCSKSRRAVSMKHRTEGTGAGDCFRCPGGRKAILVHRGPPFGGLRLDRLPGHKRAAACQPLAYLSVSRSRTCRTDRRRPACSSARKDAPDPFADWEDCPGCERSTCRAPSFAR